MSTSWINPWFRLSYGAWALGVEASYVIALRSLKMAAGGPAAAAEASLMVSEKVAASLELQAKALGAGAGRSVASSAAKTVRHYRGKVQANRRRLTKR